MRIYSSLWNIKKGTDKNMKKYMWILLQRKTKLLKKESLSCMVFLFRKYNPKSCMEWSAFIEQCHSHWGNPQRKCSFVGYSFRWIHQLIRPIYFEATLQVSQKSKSRTSEFKYVLFTTVHNSNFEPLLGTKATDLIFWSFLYYTTVKYNQ